MLEYRNTKLAVVEAKAWGEAVTEGVAQAKNDAGKLAIRYGFSTNGQGIYGIDMETGKEGGTPAYPTPEALWASTFAEANAWRDRFAAIPFEDRGGYFLPRYYQDIAVERVLQAIAADAADCRRNLHAIYPVICMRQVICTRPWRRRSGGFLQRILLWWQRKADVRKPSRTGKNHRLPPPESRAVCEPANFPLSGLPSIPSSCIARTTVTNSVPPTPVRP